MLARDDGNVVLRSSPLARPSAEVLLAWQGVHPGDWQPGRTSGKQVRFCTGAVAREACEQGSPTYASVRRPNLYPGVDLVLHAANGPLEYDLELQPGARVEDIRFQLDGPDAPALDSDGRLRAGAFVQWRPVAFQWIGGERRPVECSVRSISVREFGFAITGPRREDLPLIIDPVIESGYVVAGSESGEEQRVLGEAAGHVFGLSRRVGSSSWDVFVVAGGVTTYWGGDGDEQLAGFDVEWTNGKLNLVGWTASRNVYTTGTVGQNTAYHGGESDGFFLEFFQGRLVEAAVFGGPGADRINDVRRTAAVGYNGPYLIVGETDDRNWPGFKVEGQARGRADAIAGWIGSSVASLVITGGAGNDTARMIRSSAATGEWFVAGETDSTGFAGKTRDGRDAWVARLSVAPLGLSAVKAWGGSGDDRLAGMEVIAGHGVMLAGTTSSSDLPGAVSEFNGGSSDGFVAWLGLDDFSPKLARYLGGPGADEITSATSWTNDLFLVGFTDSPTLSISGLTPGSDPAGRQDALFVHTDALLNPMVAYRAGGSGDDRFTGVSPRDWGRVDLAGWSESRPWLSSLEQLAPPGDNTAGFRMTLRYAVIAASEADQWGAFIGPPIPTLGRDLQMLLSVRVANEPGTDGVLIARSLDPTRLRIAGAETVLLNRVGEPGGDSLLALEALAEEGEVDVVITGRTPGAGPVRYPERRLRVRLAPSRAFLRQPASGVVDAVRGLEFALGVIYAPMLPNGELGTPRDARSGLDLRPTLVSSDPEALVPSRPGPYRSERGVYSLYLKALREGTYTGTLFSEGIPPAPGQNVRVTVTGESAQPFPWPRRIAALVDHGGAINFTLASGDVLRFSSDDPARVRLGSAPGEASGSLNFTGPGRFSIWFFSIQAGDPVAVRIEGTMQSRPVSQQIEVLPWPYAIRVNSFYGRRLAPGAGGSLVLETNPKGPLPPDTGYPFNSIRPDSPLGQARLRFSDGGVVDEAERTTDGNKLYLNFRAARLGRTTMSIEHDAAPEPMIIEVVPPRVTFNAPLIVPTGAKVGFLVTEYLLSPGSQRTVRIRVSDPLLFALEWRGLNGTDLTIDPAQYYYVNIEAKGPPGGNGALLVSAPGMDETSFPIRVVEKIVLPYQTDLRLRFAPGQAELRGDLSYTVAAFDSSAGVASGARVVTYGRTEQAGLKVRLTSEPAGVCELPAEVESGQFELSVPFVCRHEGRVRVDVQAPELSADQAKFSVWLTVTRPPRPPLYEGYRVSAAAGTQTELTLFPAQQRFVGTLTSSDPERVKLSPSPTQLGSGQFSTSNSRTLYVQAFGSDGVVWITAEDADGGRGEIPVFLYPATMAVRVPGSFPGTFSPGSKLRIPADQSTLAASAMPFAFDPGSGLLLENGGGLILRAGIDPFFLKPASSDNTVAVPVPPNPLFGEADGQRPVNFRIVGKGSALLTVEQPAGFMLAPEAALRLTVAERDLKLVVPAVAPGLQSSGSVTAAAFSTDNVSSGQAVAVTLTSLDPAKLLLSASSSTLGSASLSTTVGTPIRIQVSPSVQPGERLRVRVAGAGFSDSITELPVSEAQLQWYEDRSEGISLSPGVDTFFNIRYGPADVLNPGRVNANWSGGLLPGASMRLSVRSADPSLLSVAQTDIDLKADVSALVTMQGRRPGETEFLVSAPPGVLNRIERTPVRVGLWEFQSSSLDGAWSLWAPMTIRNPRAEATTVAVQSVGQNPLGFSATTTTPPASALSVTVAAREQRTIYWTAFSQDGPAQVRLRAPDFADQILFAGLSGPQLVFSSISPLQLAAANRTASLPLLLMGRGEMPLATAPMQVEVRSSDPRIVRVPTGSVEFKTGQSSAAVNVELLAPGTVTLTAVAPASLSGSVQTTVLTQPHVGPAGERIREIQRRWQRKPGLSVRHEGRRQCRRDHRG